MKTSTLTQPASETAAFESLLNSFVPLGSADRAVIHENFGSIETHPAGAHVQSPCRVLVSGWMGWRHEFADGRRQIVSILLPGDLLPPAHSGELAMGNTALTTARTADASHLLRLLAEGSPRTATLARAFRVAQAVADARLVRQVIRLGRLSAHQRTADLLLDLLERQRRAGLVAGAVMRLPLTQEMLADMLGLSVVHVNRTLQLLRRENVIQSRVAHSLAVDEASLRRTAGPGPLPVQTMRPSVLA